MNSRYAKGVAALLIGCALNHFGDRLLGIKVELFHGLTTFSPIWIVDVFFVPFVVGLGVAWVFGFGAWWLSYFPPLIVRVISYAEIYYLSEVPEGVTLLRPGFWGFIVILAMESASIGGIIGEVMIKKVYGRTGIPAQATGTSAPSNKQTER